MKCRAVTLLLLFFVQHAAAQSDAVATLGKAIQDGQVQPRFDPELGWMPWLLEQLDIPLESQMLVFSKTSVQGLIIGPNRPRRIYFNDSVAVGTVKGGSIELAAQDPQNGLQFYLLDQNASRYAQWAAQPKRTSPFSRRPDCMNCHLSKTTGIAQFRIRSVVPAKSGAPIEPLGGYETDNRTPFYELWGGWFVTGSTEASHRGNTVWDPMGHPTHVDPPGPSDIAALLVFQHQVRIMNLIAQTGIESRRTGKVSSAADELADALLFTDESPLPSPVHGNSEFREKFQARGPRDSLGRSLRELDLNTRLLRYPCSYLIYSPAFDALPFAVKSAVYSRMNEILATRDAAGRDAILAILRATRPDFPQL